MSNSPNSNSDQLEHDLEKNAPSNGGKTNEHGSPAKPLIRALTERLSGRHAFPSVPVPITSMPRDMLPREGHVFEIDQDAVFGATQHHVEYSHLGRTLKGLAKFDDCTDYGISEIAERSLLQTEVERLVRVVKDDEPLMFPSEDLFPAGTNADAFEDLSNLADQLQCNAQIIRHDSARLSLEYMSDDLEDIVRIFRSSRRIIINRFKQDKTNIEGASPKTLIPPDRNQRLYFALVDLITATVGRLLVRTAEGPYWHQETLSVLARWATKLKVLSYDPKGCADVCLGSGTRTIEDLNVKFEEKEGYFLKIRVNQDKEQSMKSFDALDADTDVSSRYFTEKTHFRRSLHDLMQTVVDGLLNSPDSKMPANCFETCVMVYRTGLDGTPTTLSGDRSGQISASPDPFNIKCTYTALELARRNLQTIPSTPGETSTKITWEWDDQHGPKARKIETTSMENLISLIAPLALSSTYASINLDFLVTLALSLNDQERPVRQFCPPPRAFRALFTVSTADWKRRERNMSGVKYRDQDILPLSKTPMRLGVRAGTNLDRIIAMGDRDSPSTPIEYQAEEVTHRYQHDKTRMDKWVVAEESITVICTGYVSCIIGLALFIVCGGMAVPFAVGTRIRGVDPFQVTTFAWVVAVFITIIAKSRYVNEWPWHEFLRGRVVCRSIKDLAEVTGIDPQMVLMYLLLEERGNTLQTRGPYHGMFLRQAESGSGGFSIDVAVRLSTMLASGFVLLKVSNEYGEHLICLDVRKGSRGEAPVTGKADKYLAYLDIGKDVEYYMSTSTNQQQGQVEGTTSSDSTRSRIGGRKSKIEARALKKVKKLKKEEIRWFKVLGIYVKDEQFG